MKTVISVFILLFNLFVCLQAQNLVPNPSFEECYDFPSKQGEFELVKGWFMPYNRGNTPDYFHREAKEPDNYWEFMKVPNNLNGYQEPKSGYAYCGIFVWPETEIIGCKLIKELGKESFYKVIFHISLIENVNYAIDNIGCYFSDTKIRYVSKGAFNKKIKEQKYKFIPQITSSVGTPIIDTENWTKISGIFKAKGGEKYMYIGCFSSLSELKVKKIKRRSLGVSYYLIDDVSVVEVDSLGIPVKHEMKTDTLVVVSDSLNSELENTKTGESIVLKNIQFEFNKSNLLSESFKTLDELSAYLELNKTIILEVSGHTDSIGSISKNLELSLERAKAVREYLIKRGIKQGRIKYKGYGNQQPIADNKTEEGRKINRRVEIKIIKK